MSTKITFTDFVKNYAIREIENFEECENVSICELSYMLIESDLISNTVEFYISRAEELIMEWSYDAEQFFNYEKNNFGDVTNPFENPCKYVGLMVNWGLDNLIYSLPLYNQYNDEQFTIDRNFIDLFIKQVGDIDDISIYN